MSSAHPSVTLRYDFHSGWNTLKIISQLSSLTYCIHGAIVAATVGAIVGATIAPCIHYGAIVAPTGRCDDRSDSRGDDRPLYKPYKDSALLRLTPTCAIWYSGDTPNRAE